MKTQNEQQQLYMLFTDTEQSSREQAIKKFWGRMTEMITGRG